MDSIMAKLTFFCSDNVLNPPSSGHYSGLAPSKQILFNAVQHLFQIRHTGDDHYQFHILHSDKLRHRYFVCVV